MTPAKSASGRCAVMRARTLLGTTSSSRAGSRRLRPDPETGELRLTRHGQLVMDWVELFAPVSSSKHTGRLHGR